MSEVTIIGIDLAKRVFHLHGARVDGSVVFRKKVSRAQLLAFFTQHPRCIVAMEACATAHGWGREFEKLVPRDKQDENPASIMMRTQFWSPVERA